MLKFKICLLLQVDKEHKKLNISLILDTNIKLTSYVKNHRDMIKN